MADPQETWDSTPIIINPRPTIGKDVAPIPIKSKAQESWSSTPIGQSSKIDPSTIKLTGDKSNWFKDYVAPIAKSGLIDLGVATGGTIAAPTGPPGIAAGGILGGMAGNEVYKLLQQYMPTYFGQREQENIPQALGSDITDAGLNQLVGTVTNKVVGAGGKVIGSGSKLFTQSGRDELKAGLLNKFFPINPVIDVQGALLSPEGQALKPTVGQYTQSEFGKFAEDTLQGQAKRELFATQQQTLENQAQNLVQDVSKGKFSGIKTGDLSPSEIGAAGKESASAVYDAAKNSEKARWKNLLENAVPKETDYTMQGGKIIKVEGPIYANSTNQFATTISKQLDSAIERNPDPAVKSYLQNLKNRVDGYVTLPKSARTKEPVLDYVSAKNDKDYFTRIIGDKDSPPEISREIGLIKSLRNLLSNDINDSVQNGWSDKGRQAFQRAQAKTQSIADAFYGGDKDLAMLSPELRDQAALEQAISDPKIARTYRMQTGSRTELGTEYVRNILNKAQAPNGYFDGNTAAKMLSDTGDVANEALTSSQRTALKGLITRMQGVDPKLAERGAVGLAFKTGSAILALSGATLGALTGHFPVAAAGGAGTMIASIAMGKNFVEKTMLNPNTARMMATLSHLPPQSTQAQSITKYLFRTALKGETVNLVNPQTNESQQAVVQSNGSLKFKQ